MSQAYSATELAAMLGISTRRLRELAAEGVIPRLANGRYPSDAPAAYCKQLRDIAAGRASADEDSPDLVKERALLARTQRQALEQKMAIDAEELVDARTVVLRFAEMVTRARTRLLGLGSAAKGRIPKLTVHDIEEIELLVAQALEELAEDED
jgi:phage terminase Nu1 subunit (DNA packaging protein)